MRGVDVSWELGKALQSNLPALPEKSDYWSEARGIMQDLANRGIVLSSTLEVRVAALDAALRSASGRLSAEQTAAAATTLLAFLAGDPIDQPGEVTLRGDDLKTVMRVIGNGGFDFDDSAERALHRRLRAACLHHEEAQAWEEKP